MRTILIIIYLFFCSIITAQTETVPVLYTLSPLDSLSQQFYGKWQYDYSIGTNKDGEKYKYVSEYRDFRREQTVLISNDTGINNMDKLKKIADVQKQFGEKSIREEVGMLNPNFIYLLLAHSSNTGLLIVNKYENKNLIQISELDLHYTLQYEKGKCYIVYTSSHTSGEEKFLIQLINENNYCFSTLDGKFVHYFSRI